MPKVSIVIPTYNRVAYLRWAIESAIAQTFTDHEIIVVDNGSTDETYQLVHSLDDPRIRYVYQENRGPAGARNTGVRHAKGEYIAFLDDDDYFLPEKLAWQVPALDQQPDNVAFIASGHLIVDASGHTLSEEEPWEVYPDLNLQVWLEACPVIVNSILIRKSWYEKIGYSDENLALSDDWDMWIRMSSAGATMPWLKTIVCAYRMHSSNMISNVKGNRDSYFMVYDKFFKSDYVPEEILASKNAYYARAHLIGAGREYHAGYLEDAKKDVDAAIALHPELLSDNGAQLFKLLVDWAGTPLVRDPIRYLETVFDNLPDSAKHLQSLKSKAIAQIFMRDFFRAYKKGDFRLVRKSLLRAIRHDMSWLHNFGVISIFVESVIGSSAKNFLKSLLRNPSSVSKS